MGLVKYRFHADTINMDTEVNLILPDKKLRLEGRYPVLYLLHGAGGDCESWLRHSSIERYALAANLAVVMPSAYNSCYADMAHGIPYFTFLSEELPERLETLFPIANNRAGRFVAGLSMGGRGAFLWAMRRPEFFTAAACLSGSLNITAMAQRMRARGDMLGLHRFENAFGDLSTVAGSRNDVYTLAKQLAVAGDAIPELLYTCGTEDIRYTEQYLPFLTYCKDIGLKVDSEESHGKHDFDYWDPCIKRVIQSFFHSAAHRFAAEKS